MCYHWRWIHRIREDWEIAKDSINICDKNKGKIEVMHIPLEQLRQRVNKGELNEYKDANKYRISPMCAVGKRGYVATRFLRQKGFINASLCSGGMATYHMIKQEFNY